MELRMLWNRCLLLYFPAPYEHLINLLLLLQSLKKHLMADVDVGVFLSGGLDSSLLAGLAKKYLPNLHTFSVGVESLEVSRALTAHMRSHECTCSIHADASRTT